MHFVNFCALSVFLLTLCDALMLVMRGGFQQSNQQSKPVNNGRRHRRRRRREEDKIARKLDLLRAGIRQQQVLAAFGGRESRLARRLLKATAAEASIRQDPAEQTWADALGRMRQTLFGDSKPWIDERPRWAGILEAATDDMRSELLNGGNWTSSGASYQKIAPDWKFTPLWRDGEFLQKERFPRTIAALERAIAAGLRLHPFQDLACGFARLPAGAEIVPHCDGGLVSYTAHLGIIVPPDDCALTVDNETRQWHQGRIFQFDASYRHSARNFATTDRYVLLLQAIRDIIHDDDIQPLNHALRVPHPALGKLHPILLRNDGTAFATWRDDINHHDTDLVLATTSADGHLLTAADDDALFIVDAALYPQDVQGRPSRWRDAPFHDRPLHVDDDDDDNLGHPPLGLEEPDLLAVDVRTGSVEWLGFARDETTAGRFLKDPSSADELIQLQRHAAYLAHPTSAAKWLPWGDPQLHEACRD